MTLSKAATLMTQLMDSYPHGGEAEWRRALRKLVELGTDDQLLGTLDQREAVDYLHVVLLASQRQERWAELGHELERYLAKQHNKYERRPIPARETLRRIENLQDEEERLQKILTISKLREDARLMLMEEIQRIEENIHAYQAEQDATKNAIGSIVSQLR